MKRFNTKKDLLRYLWKNEDDRKLVTRMIERGEVRLEWRVYIIDDGENWVSEVSSSSSSSSDLENRLSNDLENRLSSLSNDLEYLNREYEKLEGLLDYSLRKCYGIMKKRGLVGSEDTYDDFYSRITDGYLVDSAKNINVAHTTEGGEALKDKNDLGSIMNKFGIKKASDLI